MPAIRALLLALLCVSLTGGAEVRTLKGKVHKGDLVSVSEAELVVNENGTQTKVPVAQVLFVDFGPVARVPGEAVLITPKSAR